MCDPTVACDPYTMLGNLQNAKSRKIIERANDSREIRVMPKPWSRSIFARKIFWKLSLSESETTYPKLKSDSFSPKSLDRIARYLHFCENIFGKSASHSRHDLPCACSIKYCLYVCTSHVSHFRCGRKPVRAWAPGRAAQNTIPLIFAFALQNFDHFSEP